MILYPTGGGTGLIGMWKAFQELKELGWLKSEKMPRLISCQAEGCAPIVRAFDAGARFAELFPNAQTVASGLRVPAAVGDFMMLDAIRASAGLAIDGTRSDHRRLDAPFFECNGHQHLSRDGHLLRRAGAADRGGKNQTQRRSARLQHRGSAKYLEALPAQLPRIDKDKGFPQ